MRIVKSVGKNTVSLSGLVKQVEPLEGWTQFGVETSFSYQQPSGDLREEIDVCNCTVENALLGDIEGFSAGATVEIEGRLLRGRVLVTSIHVSLPKPAPGGFALKPSTAPCLDMPSFHVLGANGGES
ncbi:hypothetical protein A3709_20875 [Halioglobus sp. HI00S01]|uniref:hypothetical protein n=3 Tax=Halioglobus sp. HI00S01 TaxID=1822214 RepID=UPI0007C2255D|nr:hypothetical protein [Halioglobus sp. HI00S01]KZX58068.1 hypothetical protein A3709_20875 [Halioglobus sp. HI00S01]